MRSRSTTPRKPVHAASAAPHLGLGITFASSFLRNGMAVSSTMTKIAVEEASPRVLFNVGVFRDSSPKAVLFPADRSSRSHTYLGFPRQVLPSLPSAAAPTHTLRNKHGREKVTPSSASNFERFFFSLVSTPSHTHQLQASRGEFGAVDGL
ncbi:unnamed protein product [Caenorhabditis auriculariae]|uniref:Uncharacterized protein n=1 Tax=Caenorhabditis auriculariae TaxID=2777116 RepID=A0A8S1HHC5_9PELO|nr:unnamed protein product [Caenorhabditis auriculariae]